MTFLSNSIPCSYSSWFVNFTNKSALGYQDFGLGLIITALIASHDIVNEWKKCRICQVLAPSYLSGREATFTNYIQDKFHFTIIIENWIQAKCLLGFEPEFPGWVPDTCPLARPYPSWIKTKLENIDIISYSLLLIIKYIRFHFES